MKPEISAYGPVVRRYCLCVIFYLWEFSYDEEIRRKRIDRTTDASRRDLLGSVKPFIDEISLALDDPSLSALERQMLERFIATYEGVLDLVRVPFEKVDPNWDHYQLPPNTRLNRILFEVFRGLDLYERGHLEDAEVHLLEAWPKLVAIEKRRVLPDALRRLLEKNQDLVERFQKELDLHRNPPEVVIPDTSGLPAIGFLLKERQSGRAPGLSDLSVEIPSPPVVPKAPPDALVIALEPEPEVNPWDEVGGPPKQAAPQDPDLFLATATPEMAQKGLSAPLGEPAEEASPQETVIRGAKKHAEIAELFEDDD